MITMSSMRSHKLVLFFAISCLLFHEKCTDASVCKDSERKALLEFKHSLQAISFSGINALFSWKSEECCLWRGVYCNSFTGYVEMLDFSDQPLVVAGTISPSLLKLHHLTSLNFTSNDFNGSLIPEFFASLKKLKLLDLSNANFRGPIPSLLGNLSMLETLRLGGNGRVFNVGKLEWLSHLSRLKEVDLSFTNLSNANDCNLVSLNLSSNKLKGPIPDAFGNMKAIQELYLNDNLLVLAENQVWGDSGLNEIGKLPDFRVLDLGYNLLNGSISKSIGQLSNLHVAACREFF
ncbi:hypothetical protein Gotur_032399 [Gossypium turneri]